jgi:hypothetical protein
MFSCGGRLPIEDETDALCKTDSLETGLDRSTWRGERKKGSRRRDEACDDWIGREYVMHKLSREVGLISRQKKQENIQLMPWSRLSKLKIWGTDVAVAILNRKQTGLECKET